MTGSFGTFTRISGHFCEEFGRYGAKGSSKVAEIGNFCLFRRSRQFFGIYRPFLSKYFGSLVNGNFRMVGSCEFCKCSSTGCARTCRDDQGYLEDASASGREGLYYGASGLAQTRGIHSIGRSYSSTQSGNDPESDLNKYVEVLKTAKDLKTTKYTRLDDLSELVKVVDSGLVRSDGNSKFLSVPQEVLRQLTFRAFTEIMHFLRSEHLEQLKKVLDDPEASDNDKFVSMQLIKNACIAAGRVLPGCQDTGTAIILGKRGNSVFSEGDDLALTGGVYDAYMKQHFRYSQMSPLSMYEEVNTKCNLPAQIELYAQDGMAYDFLFIAKGGGSANKTFLYQQTKAVLNEPTLVEFLMEQIKTIGTSACPPYHLAIVVGGLSAEMTLKTVKLASCKYLDALPTQGGHFGHAFRDLVLEDEILKRTRTIGIGAQFGGKYFCHDVRVVRLPRHGASCPIGIGVSCSADRQILAKIDESGVYLEQLEHDPAQYLPEVSEVVKPSDGKEVRIDLSLGMAKVLEQIRQYPVKTRLLLSGPLIVARDIAHAKIVKQFEETGKLPDYFKDFPIYYAGPAKTPEGYVSGSFGPTTAGRMDVYAQTLMKNGASLVTLAKGNRSTQFRRACKEYGGVYLGSVGGPAALIAHECIKNVQVIDFHELGMEAVHRIHVEDFPAFIVIDSQGNDLYLAE